MIKMFNKRSKNQKGFTLIELIVVIAIMGILAGIAVPRFSGIQETSRIKADAATASQIVNAARIQQTNDSENRKVVPGTPGTGEVAWDNQIMVIPTNIQSGSGVFTLEGGGSDQYTVKWVARNEKTYIYTEGQVWDIETSVVPET